MNTPLSWIKAYVPELEVGDHEYCDAMTLSGTKVEGFTRLDKNLEKIVVGHIESIERHPDADKLIICQVNVGTETIQIVTGAAICKISFGQWWKTIWKMFLIMAVIAIVFCTISAGL